MHLAMGRLTTAWTRRTPASRRLHKAASAAPPGARVRRSVMRTDGNARRSHLAVIGWWICVLLATAVTVAFVGVVIYSLPAKHEEGVVIGGLWIILLIIAVPTALLRPRPLVNSLTSAFLMWVGAFAVYLRVALHYEYGVLRSDLGMSVLS